MINWLKDDYDLTIVGLGQGKIKRGKFIHINRTPRTLLNLLKKGLMLLLRIYPQLNWLPEIKRVFEILKNDKFDLIISHDIVLLPLAFALKKQSKILFDAREYYPRQFEDRFIWRLLFSPYYAYLCKEFLPLIDKIITPSPGLAIAYKKEYKVNVDVIMGFPTYENLKSIKVSDHKIRIIHHGICSPSRKIEKMVYMMDYLDNKYSLDLMLVRTDNNYYKKIKSLASVRKNVRVIPPVHFKEIINFTNQYDIGLFLLSPSNFNLRAALPNKIFEYIQARLALAISPNEEMAKIVNQYDCGIVAKDFSPEAMAETISSLNTNKIQYYKEKSNQVAKELCAEKNRDKILNMVVELIG
jgi:glycosyltransferase involved in cell wall biosynthesis